MSMQLAAGSSVWETDRSLIVGEHGCWFCAPYLYPPMPEGRTLCVRCGVLMAATRSDVRDGATCFDCLSDLALDEMEDG